MTGRQTRSTDPLSPAGLFAVLEPSPTAAQTVHKVDVRSQGRLVDEPNQLGGH